MSHKTVGNHVKKYRTAMGMTQAELAEHVGVSRVSIVAIENGRFIPTIETALQIGKALNLSLEEIFWIKDDEK